MTNRKLLLCLLLACVMGALVLNTFIGGTGGFLLSVLWGFAVGHWTAANFDFDGKLRRNRSY